jgi:hypothetical protein
MLLTGFTLQGMALAMPEVLDHPNRHPFSGVLTKLDEPSTRPPEGSGGKLVILSAQVAEAALPSLLGMAVDYQDAVGHDPKKKIGIITVANVVGNEIQVEGFLYAQDFPVETAQIRVMRSTMGMSFELARVLVEDLGAPILAITSCMFTGAAILRKDKAAYHHTSLRAAHEKEDFMTDEQFQTFLASATTGMTTISTALLAQGEALGKLAASQEATNKILASKMEKEDQEDEGADDGGKKPGKGKKAPDEEADDMDAASVALKASVETLKTELATLKAAAAKAAEPERKTLAGDAMTLLAKHGIAVPAEGTKMSAAAMDEALAKTGMSTVERMAFKSSLAKSGAFEAQ